MQSKKISGKKATGKNGKPEMMSYHEEMPTKMAVSKMHKKNMKDMKGRKK